MNTRFLALGATTLSLGLAGIVGAQPGMRPDGGRQNNGRPGIRDFNGDDSNRNAEDRASSPQEREQADAARRTQRLQEMLERGGVTGTDAQAVVAFATAQGAATRDVRDKARALSQALHAPATTDAQIATLLSDFRASAAKEKTRRAQAVNALDARIHFSRKPRLEALLTTMGLVGDAVLLGGPGMGGPPRRGGPQPDGFGPGQDGFGPRAGGPRRGPGNGPGDDNGSGFVRPGRGDGMGGDGFGPPRGPRRGGGFDGPPREDPGPDDGGF